MSELNKEKRIEKLAREILAELLEIANDKQKLASLDYDCKVICIDADACEKIRNLAKDELFKYVDDRFAELKKKCTEEGK